MKKSGYLFFGFYFFLFALIPINQWLLPGLKEGYYMQEERVAIVLDLAEAHIEENYPDAVFEVQQLSYYHVSEQYTVEVFLSDDSGDCFLTVSIPQNIEEGKAEIHSHAVYEQVKEETVKNHGIEF